jgi:futalosine hydrolase
MEGFSLALACRERQLPFLEIRTVSNPVGERDRSKWDMGQALRGLGKTLAELLGRG